MLNALLQTVGVALLVGIAAAAVCWVWRPRPAFCHALWLLVVVKLLMPPVVAWPWQPDAAFLGRVAGYFAGDEPGPAGMVGDAEPKLMPAAWLGQEAVKPAGTEAAEAAGRRPVLAAVGYAGLSLWLAGAVVAGVLHLRRIGRFRRALRASERGPAWLEEKVAGLARVYGVRAPEVRVAEGVWSAVLYGVRRPVLLAPRGAVEEVEPGRWETVVAHELAHLKRRDNVVAWVVLAASCLWWWNPVLWWARSRLGRYAEMACDAWVLWALPERGREYADTLIHFVQRHSEGFAPVPEPVPCMSSHGAGVFERRLTAILRGPGPYRLGATGAACLVALAAIVLPVFSQEEAAAPVSAVVQKAEESQPALVSNEPMAVGETSPELEAALDSLVNIDFTDIHVSEFADFVHEAYGVNLAIDWRAVQPPDFIEVNAVVTSAPPPGASEVKEDDLQVTRVEGPASVPKAVHGGYVTDGRISYLRLSGVPLREAIGVTTRTLKLTYVVYPDVVFITSPEMAAADEGRVRPGLPPHEKLAEVLEAQLALDFEKCHLQEVVEFISQTYDLNIVIDQNAVLQPDEDVSAAREGVVSTGYLPYFRVQGVPVGETLDVLLRSINLTFYAEDNYIWISGFGGGG